MRRASLHTKIGIERAPGLSNLLGDSNSITSALREYKSKADDTYFNIIPSGETPRNPSELLNSDRMANLLEKLGAAYDYIIVDLPPIGAVVDAVSVAKKLDGMLIVVRENNCPRGLLEDCMQQLRYAEVNILGFVMNGAMEGSGKGYGYGKYGKYGKYYKSGYYNNYY
jgi:capsular exopolysaccharide synthesis family protein